MRTPRTCHKFHIQHATVIILYHVCITSLVLIYVIIERCYLLIKLHLFTFWPPASNPLPSPPASGNHKSDLFFFRFVLFVWKCNWPTTLCEFLRHTTVFWYFCTFRTITVISVAMICSHTKIRHRYGSSSPHCTFHAHDSFILLLDVCTS